MTWVPLTDVLNNYYASRDSVKLTVCTCVSVPAVTAQRLQCDEN